MSEVNDNGGLTLPYPTVFLFYDGEEPEYYTALTGENLNRPIKQLMANIERLQTSIASGGAGDALLDALNSKMPIAGGNFTGPVTMPSWSDAGGSIPDNALINKGDIVQLIKDYQNNDIILSDVIAEQLTAEGGYAASPYAVSKVQFELQTQIDNLGNNVKNISNKLDQWEVILGGDDSLSTISNLLANVELLNQKITNALGDIEEIYGSIEGIAYQTKENTFEQDNIFHGITTIYDGRINDLTAQVFNIGEANTAEGQDDGETAPDKGIHLDINAYSQENPDFEWYQTIGNYQLQSRIVHIITQDQNVVFPFEQAFYGDVYPRQEDLDRKDFFQDAAYVAGNTLRVSSTNATLVESVNGTVDIFSETTRLGTKDASTNSISTTEDEFTSNVSDVQKLNRAPYYTDSDPKAFTYQNQMLNVYDTLNLINDTYGSNKALARALAIEKSYLVVDYDYATLSGDPDIGVSRADETNQIIRLCKGETASAALNLVAHLKFYGVKFAAEYHMNWNAYRRIFNMADPKTRTIGNYYETTVWPCSRLDYYSGKAETLIKFYNLSNAGSKPMTIKIGSTAILHEDEYEVVEPDKDNYQNYREYPVTFPQFSLPPKITLQPNEYATLRCILNYGSATGQPTLYNTYYSTFAEREANSIAQPFVAIEVSFGTF